MSVESDRLLRERIGSKLAAFMSDDQIQVLLEEILALKKRAWAEFRCKSCGQQQKQSVEVPDAVNVTKALLDLANQSFGTPGRAADPPRAEVVEEFVPEDYTSLDMESLRRLARG